MRAVEAAKQMIKKTKEKLREEEREKELRQKFEEIFGFPPEKVWWDGVLKANYVVNFDEETLDEETIMGEPVKEVIFWVVEEKIDLGFDLDWNFSKSKEEEDLIYRWTRKLRRYIAVIEIITQVGKF